MAGVDVRWIRLLFRLTDRKAIGKTIRQEHDSDCEYLLV